MNNNNNYANYVEEAITRIDLEHKSIILNLKNYNLRHESTRNAMFGLLEKEGYSNLEFVGSGAFGMVVKALNPEGFSRALKLQICEDDFDDVEF